MRNGDAVVEMNTEYRWIGLMELRFRRAQADAYGLLHSEHSPIHGLEAISEASQRHDPNAGCRFPLDPQRGNTIINTFAGHPDSHRFVQNWET